jgi:hypothetical protein
MRGADPLGPIEADSQGARSPPAALRRSRRLLGVRHMFFRSRRHESARCNPCVADQSHARSDGKALRQDRQLQKWRQSAQRVTRTWNAWRAAEGGDRGQRYRAFVAALVDEETAAAEVERVTELAQARACVNPTDLRTG